MPSDISITRTKHIDGLVENCSISIANTLEIRFAINTLMFYIIQSCWSGDMLSCAHQNDSEFRYKSKYIHDTHIC